MTVGDGDALLDRGRARPNVEPWPNAAQRAAARAAADRAAAVAPVPVAPSQPGRSSRPFDSATSVEAPVAPRPARPRIEEDPGLLGITRRSHSRLGSRLFTLFFVFVFVLILLQLVVVLLDG